MRVRYGISALLGAVLVLGLPLAALRHELNRRAGFESALRQLQGRGAMLVVNLGVPRHAVFSWFEDDFDIERIDYASIKGNIGDEDLLILQQLPNLKYIYVHRSNISDAGLMHLTKLRNLKRVSITSSLVTEDGVRRFRRVRPNVLVFLSGPPHRAEPMIAVQKETGVAFGYTTDRTIDQLITVSLYGDHLGDDDVRNYFGSDSLTDGLDSLTEVWIGNTQVTDTGLLHLEKLPGLKRLSISDSPVTREGIEHFKLVRPDVQVFLTMTTEDGPPTPPSP